MFSLNWAGFINIPVVIYAINFMIAFAIIFLERKNPSATLAWIMVLFMLPGVGIFLYLVLSQNIARQKIFNLSTFEASAIDSTINEQIEDMREDRYDFSNRESEKWADMIHLHLSHSRAFFTQDNSMSIYTDGNDKFDSLFTDIKNAKHSINIMYYIVKRDDMGNALIEALAEKAKEGLEVRLLIDALGDGR